MYINHKACEKVGLNIKKVQSIARRISKAAKEAEELGIDIFGGSGTGSLRFDDNGERNLIIGYIDGVFDGGDGGSMEDDEGFLRGE